jgi:phage terminase Nu1 subunit (DNA packaging protein)
MIMRALDDLGSDGIPIQNHKGGVDWAAYQNLYMEYHEQQKAAEEAPATDPHPEGAVIFGGP